jgi:hypothetical protein
MVAFVVPSNREGQREALSFSKNLDDYTKISKKA